MNSLNNPFSDSPKTALMIKETLPFVYSSSKDVRNLVRAPRSKTAIIHPQEKRRARGTSEDFVPVFSQTMYDRIEEFLDSECLHIVSPSPIVQRKPNVKLIRFGTNPEFDMSSVKDRSETATNDSDSENLPPVMPSILARRTLSAGVAQSVKHKLLTFAKADSFTNIIPLAESTGNCARIEIFCEEETDF